MKNNYGGKNIMVHRTILRSLSLHEKSLTHVIFSLEEADKYVVSLFKKKTKIFSQISTG